MARASKKKGELSPSLGCIAGSERATTSSPPTTMTTSVKEEDDFSSRSPFSPSSRTAPLMDVDMKLEPHISPSQSPTLAETSHEKMELSPTSVSATITTNGTKSETPTPPPSLQAAFSSGNSKKFAIQFIGDLPVSRDEALKTFSEISENNYQYKTLGRCKELSESMTCDCTYEHGESVRC